jgi:ATP-binding cassette, subfamily B, bacterial
MYEAMSVTRAPKHSARHGSLVRNWRTLQYVLGGMWRPVALLGVASVVAAIAESAVLALIAQVAATLLTRGNTVAIHVGPMDLTIPISNLLEIGLALATLRGLMQLALAYLQASIGANVQLSLQTRLFSAFTRASWPIQARDREGEFQELLTTQALNATTCVQVALSLVVSATMFIIFVGSALVIEPLVALVMLAVSLALFALLRPVNRLGARQGRAWSSAYMDYGAGVYQAVNLAEEVHVFGVAQMQESKVRRLGEVLRRHFFMTQLLAGVAPGTFQSAVLLLLVGALGIVYLSGDRHLASLGAVVLLLVRASSYGQQVQGAFQNLRQSWPFVDRLRQAERRYGDARVGRGDRGLVRVPSISFDRVTYSYGRSTVALHQVSFQVDPGASIGIIGPSGAGKSTLVQLLLGLREPDSGHYDLDGHPSRSFSFTDWTRAVAYVPQEPRLLHATVAENIRFFRPLDDTAVERGAKLAGIHDEIISWPNGYQSVVGQRADAVSGGQRQRICLARALAGGPLVLVLDEPTSALDAHSEAIIRDSLLELKGDVTVFVVAHRLSTLKICDKVMVLTDGRLEAFGGREGMIESNLYYRQALEVGLV